LVFPFPSPFLLLLYIIPGGNARGFSRGMKAEPVLNSREVENRSHHAKTVNPTASAVGECQN